METSFFDPRVQARFRLAAGAEDLPPYCGDEATCFLSERQKAGKERVPRAVKEAHKEQYPHFNTPLSGNPVKRTESGSASSLTSSRRRGEDLSPRRSRSRTFLMISSSAGRAPMNALVITDASRMGARLGHRLFNGLSGSRFGCPVNMVHQIEIVFV